MTTRERPLLAVLIDADNVPAKYAEVILKEIASIGEPALRRVYGDWSAGRLQPWVNRIHDAGLVARQETANTTGKNASDIGLVIDAMDILHSGKFDGFVLVSSDSDFTSLANRLREDGLIVLGVGEKKAPASLRNVCNRFIFIENLVEEQPETPGGQKPAGARKDSPQNAVPLIIEAMERIDQEGDWFNLGRVGQTILASHPDFDTRTYGMKKLSDLVKTLARFETQKRGDQLMIRRAD